jgi:hypothetical protein
MTEAGATHHEDFGYSTSIYHVGYLVTDIAATMADLGASLGLTWTEVVVRDAQRMWTPKDGATTVPLTFAYSQQGPQYVELLQGSPGSIWDSSGSPGLHHAGVWADVPALTNSLLAKGWTLECSQLSPDEGYGSFTYVRSPTGFLLEPVDYRSRPRIERWFAGEPLQPSHAK